MKLGLEVYRNGFDTDLRKFELLEESLRGLSRWSGDCSSSASSLTS